MAVMFPRYACELAQIGPLARHPCNRSAQVASSDPDYLAARIAGRAIPRAQTPEDLVGAVMFLAAPASDFITGQTINVDGGRAMH